MSALTKIFVVLLVIVSLLLSAGLIVFVNRQENYRVMAETAKAHSAEAERQSSLRNQEMQKIREQLAAGLAEKDTQLVAVKKDLDTANASIVTLNQTIAEDKQNITQLTAANTSATAALTVAQNDIKARQVVYDALREENDKVQKRVVEESNQITALTNERDVLARHDRFMAEQVSQLQATTAQQADLLRKYNISPTGNTAPATGEINPVPSVNINGVVRDFKNINGVPYATISLGSADAVTRGMKFNVIDPTHNQFLGYLVVDTVQPHEATGHLNGPGVNQVRANVSEVRTQL